MTDAAIMRLKAFRGPEEDRAPDVSRVLRALSLKLIGLLGQDDILMALMVLMVRKEGNSKKEFLLYGLETQARITNNCVITPQNSPN